MLATGLSFVEEKHDRGVVRAALLAQAEFLTDCGRFREARRALWELRRRLPKTGRGLYERKIRWLEGQIFVGLGDLGRAEQALLRVREDFQKAGLPFKAALAGLDLGSVWLRQDRFEEATAIVLDCTGVLLSLKIARGLPGLALLLHEASRRGKLTLALLERIIVSVRKVEREPAGHLQPAAEG